MALRIFGVGVVRRRIQFIVGALVLCLVLYLIISQRFKDDSEAQTGSHMEGYDFKHSHRYGKNQQEIPGGSSNQYGIVNGRNDSTIHLKKSPMEFKGPQNPRQTAVVEAMKHAWSSYALYAWGKDELKPLSKGWINWMHVGLTIVDSLDTLYIMGLKDEYNTARDWVAHNLTFDKDVDVQMFEIVIRELGGLLAAYHLTNDQIFLDKASDLGNRLAHCIAGPAHIPCNRVNLRKSSPQFSVISAAEAGTIQLEFIDLSRSLHNDKYEKLARAISEKLHTMPGKVNGLVPNFINALKGQFKHSEISVGASGDSYYEYLLKQWLQTGKQLNQLKDDYIYAVEGMKSKLLRFTQPNHMAFMGLLHANQNTLRTEMEHLACFLPGTLALGAMNGLDSSHLDLAANMTRTCYEMYASMPTGLSPESAGMNVDPNNKKDIYILFNNRYNAQRPETVESLFYLYRATKEEKYRDWGWKIFESFEKWTRVEGGYSGLENVDSLGADKTPPRKDKMESFFLSETLKYFYLLFADDDPLPLDKFVFNTEAHPLPIYTSV